MIDVQHHPTATTDALKDSVVFYDDAPDQRVAIP